MLCRLGIRSLVLESSEKLRITGFALTLWTNAWRALDVLGIGDSLRQHYHRITKWDVIHKFVLSVFVVVVMINLKGFWPSPLIYCCFRFQVMTSSSSSEISPDGEGKEWVDSFSCPEIILISQFSRFFFFLISGLINFFFGLLWLEDKKSKKINASYSGENLLKTKLRQKFHLVFIYSKLFQVFYYYFLFIKN